MRSVASVAIAIALLTSSALPCPGQGGDFGDGAQLNLAPQATAEGTWVTDDGEGGPIESLPATDAVIDGDSYMTGEYGYDTGEFGYDEGCEADPFGAYCDDPALLAGGGDPGSGNYLWDEVHAHRRTWFQVDYLSFWAKGNALPPLVTSSPIGTPPSQAGVLPESVNTTILFGNDSVDTAQRNGGRINFGYWLVDGEFVGIEGHYFALQSGGTNFFASSNFATDPDAPILARPFLNVDPALLTPREDSAVVAYNPAYPSPFFTSLTGSIDVRTTSNVQSAGALWRRLIWIDFTMQRRLDVIWGYRFFRTDDSVTIDDSSTISGGIIPTTVLTSRDQFSARNQFHGGELGLKFYQYHGPLSLEVIAKCAFGNMRESTYINGYNTIEVGGITTVNTGGLLTQPSNIGTYRRDVFAILPEGDVNLRLDVARNLRLTFGYTYIYTNRVQRSGDAINTTLNPTQINGGTLDGPAEPSFNPHDTPFWVHGATAGAEYRW